MKNSNLNFGKFRMTNILEFSGNSGEEDNFTGYTGNFGIYPPGLVSFPLFTFSHRISRIFG